MPFSSHPADLHIASHIRLACEDMRAAYALYKAGNRYTAFYLEQAVEKWMLAVLVAENVHVSISESHRLDVLLDKTPLENPLHDGFQDLTHLSVHAISARYAKTGGRLSPRSISMRSLNSRRPLKYDPTYCRSF